MAFHHSLSGPRRKCSAHKNLTGGLRSGVVRLYIIGRPRSQTETPANDGIAALLEAEMTKRKSNRALGILALAPVFCLTWLVATENRGGAVAGTSDSIGGV